MAYDDPSGVIAASVILALLAITCVALRFYSNHKKVVSNGATDWLILLALAFSTGLSVLEIYGVSQKALAYPLGGSLADPTAITTRLNIAKHVELSFLTLGVFTLGLIKSSIAFLYWRIFANHPVFRRVIIVWLVIIFLWTSTFVLAALLECGSHLLALFSTPDEYTQHCGSAIYLGWANVGSDVASDLITLAIPLPMIWSLKMPLHRKLLVAATFMLGSISVGASIAKAYIYITASLGYTTSDAILTLTAISIWNLAEVQIGIIAACAPALRPILSELLPTASFISLLDSLRHGLSTSSKQRTSDERNTKDYAKTISDENLVPPGYMGRTEVESEGTELRGLNTAGEAERDGIRVKHGVTVESA